jgi:large subunit ribosomal protein L23
MFILKKALLTEKMSILNKKGMYGFIVDKNSNKIEVKKLIEKIYKVTIKNINTINYKSKKKNKYINKKLYKGKVSSYKKVIITLKNEEIIDFYTGMNNTGINK